MTFLEDQSARLLPRVFFKQSLRMKVMHVMHHVLRPNAAARRAFAAIACDSVKVPKAWYNIQADLKVPLPPPLHPGELRPCLPDDFAPLFPMSLIQQEISTERYIDIPEPVREVLELWRPSPLFRASRWESIEAAAGCEDFLQIRRRLSIWVPQDQHSRGSDLLQQRSGNQKGHHWNWSWTVGKCPCILRSTIRFASWSLPGESVLWTEALPEGLHWDLWGPDLSIAIASDPIWSQGLTGRSSMSRIPWDCHFGSDWSMRHIWWDRQVCTWFSFVPCPHAPNCDWTGSYRTNGNFWGVPRCGRGMHRRRIQLCWNHVSVSRSETQRRAKQDSLCCCWASSLPFFDKGGLCLRFRWHCSNDSFNQSTYSGSSFHSSQSAFRRSQISCDGTSDFALERTWRIGSSSGTTERCISSRGLFLSIWGHPSCSRSDPCHRRGTCWGERCSLKGRATFNFVQYVWPWPFRYGSLAKVERRPAGRFWLPRWARARSLEKRPRFEWRWLANAIGWLIFRLISAVLGCFTLEDFFFEQKSLATSVLASLSLKKMRASL